MIIAQVATTVTSWQYSLHASHATAARRSSGSSCTRPSLQR
jgi:hypothetical protein